MFVQNQTLHLSSIFGVQYELLDVAIYRYADH